MQREDICSALFDAPEHTYLVPRSRMPIIDMKIFR